MALNSSDLQLHSIAWPGQRPFAAMPRVRRLQSQSSIISCISWAYFGHILGISWAYHRHIKGISQAYLRHSSGISRAYHQAHLKHITRHILGISSGTSYGISSGISYGVSSAISSGQTWNCCDCHDRRSWKNSSCVNLSRKQCVSLQNLRRNMKFTHLFGKFTHPFLQNYWTFTFSFQIFIHIERAG